MKKLSEIYKELGIAFSFPIEINDANGYETYYEASYGYWCRWEYDDKGHETYFEDSSDFWYRCERDADGNMTYYEDSDGLKTGTPESENEPEELCAFCDKPDVFLKGLCPICFDGHYGG
jgi:hypothetical protein